MIPNVLLRSEESDGAVSAIEVASPPGFKGPPLHRHAFDEAFYVLEGELTFQLRDELFTRQVGELAFAPRDVPHTYANRSDAPARALTICTPAGFERYFARMRAERDGPSRSSCSTWSSHSRWVSRLRRASSSSSRR
jgi:quercetin dioxygenase-like cupin family protein